jgi:hypothetical protein
VKDILVDQRSIRTIAKVEGLIGKVMEIDESTRFRADYVRVKIACRYVQKVPKTAESTLGIHLHDFIFEREIPEGQTIKIMSSGVKILGKGLEPKRMKVGDQSKETQQGGSSSQGGDQMNMTGSSKGLEQQRTNLSATSAPPSCRKANLRVVQTKWLNRDLLRVV